jgi:cellobiose phosphorylase
MDRVGLEGILGFRKRGDTLFIEPRVPAAWPGYTIEYRYGKSLYVIAIQNDGEGAGGALEVTIDGRVSEGPGIPLVDDGERHTVVVRPSVTSEAATISLDGAGRPAGWTGPEG